MNNFGNTSFLKNISVICLNQVWERLLANNGRYNTSEKKGKYTPQYSKITIWVMQDFT